MHVRACEINSSSGKWRQTGQTTDELTVQQMSKTILDEIWPESVFSLAIMRPLSQMGASASWEPTAKEEVPYSSQ